MKIYSVNDNIITYFFIAKINEMKKIRPHTITTSVNLIN